MCLRETVCEDVDWIHLAQEETSRALYSMELFVYEGVSKSFRTEPIRKYTLTEINTKGYGGKTH
jgi:hypothetical protein